MTLRYRSLIQQTLDRTYRDPCPRVPKHRKDMGSLQFTWPALSSLKLSSNICVCSVLSTPWYLFFTHSLLFLMVFNSLKFEIDIIWALVIPTIWEGDFQIMGTSIFRHKHLLGVCSNGKNQIHKGLLFQVHFCVLAGVLWRYSVLLGEMILKQRSVNF